MKRLFSTLICFSFISLANAEVTFVKTKLENDLKYRLIMCTGEIPESNVKPLYIYALEPKFNFSSKVLIYVYSSVENTSNIFLTEESNNYKALANGRYYLFNYDFTFSHVSDDLKLSEVENFHEVILDNENLKFKINAKVKGLSGMWESDDFEWTAAGDCVEHPELETIFDDPMKHFNS